MNYAKQRPGYGVVKADLTTFTSKRTAHRLGMEGERQLLGRITVPNNCMEGIRAKNRALRVSTDQFRDLVSAIMINLN